MDERSTLQRRAEQLRDGTFLGVPIDDFERGGREQLIFLLMHGLTPDSKVLDLGCGVLRAGYWLIHFLQPGHYFGIEPSADRLAVGTKVVLEPYLAAEKQPRFDLNARFDASVFNETFDYFLAYSIWTHASREQVRVMLDNFLRHSNEDGVFLATFLPARWPSRGYTGDEWVGTSHDSWAPGCIRHSFGWIQKECRTRHLSVQLIGRDTTHGQSWLRMARLGRSSHLPDIRLRRPFLPAFSRILKRLMHRASGVVRKLKS